MMKLKWSLLTITLVAFFAAGCEDEVLQPQPPESFTSSADTALAPGGNTGGSASGSSASVPANQDTSSTSTGISKNNTPPIQNNIAVSAKAQKAENLNSSTNSIKHYLAFTPTGYQKQSDDKWPLIIFLHGVSDKGDNLERIRGTILPSMAERNDTDFKFILISPQLNANAGNWVAADLDKLLADVKSKYNVDDKRVIITGFSLGGGGAWEWATASPQHFAAVVPICGWGNAKLACNLKNIPVWAFHGALDNTVNISGSQGMVNALKACGGKVQFTIYPNAGHDSWTATYNNPEVFKWMLAQRKP